MWEKKLKKCLIKVREMQVSAVFRAPTMKFNIVNEVKLTYTRKGNSEKTVLSSRDASDIFREHFDIDQIDYRESFYALYMNQANKVLGIQKISESGITSSLVDIRIIMQGALLCNAVSLIIAHNHPSGNLKPSHEDINITLKIKEAGQLLNINLLDHCIMTSADSFSFSDEGLL
ncbi:DNA repair protein RadC [Chryseobacterium rhizoplanae]|uniref:DNA repair protein RadC n=2 Tax=Chryseobacterium rhizoplanae TaxID=1609531 RepID=A0A521DLZ8_9FLAO|nr:DNA repair protein RadC [Chryseobacterium rhizoplanae]